MCVAMDQRYKSKQNTHADSHARTYTSRYKRVSNDMETITGNSALVPTSESQARYTVAIIAIAVFVSLLETSLLWWAYHRRTLALSHRGSGHFVAPSSTLSSVDQKPLSVNYHFTRQCNYQCGFCFHTAKTSFVLPIDEAKRGLKMLCEAG